MDASTWAGYKNSLLRYGPKRRPRPPRFKNNVKEAADRRRILIQELVVEGGVTFYDIADVNNSDERINHIVYDLCGFLIHARR